MIMSTPFLGSFKVLIVKAPSFAPEVRCPFPAYAEAVVLPGTQLPVTSVSLPGLPTSRQAVRPEIAAWAGNASRAFMGRSHPRKPSGAT
jgi:hypothetical protein